MRKRKISFETLGCRYNRFESAEMAYELQNAGFESSAEGERADVVVINTCAVTGKSAARARAAIRGAREANPGAKVVVTGCYSEISPEAVAGVDGVDLVVGNSGKLDIARLLERTGEDGGPKIVATQAHPETLPIRPVTNMEGRTNAYLNIQSGCDEVCSFCVVRFARGRSRSASAGDVVDRVAGLSAAGVKEAVLSGINIGQYGAGSGAGLAGLVARILDETDIRRVRLSSINPNDVTDELISLMAGEPRFCRHLHIPLQSGSDTVLRRMKRPYTAGSYERLLEKLAADVPGVGLAADVMVGFPGETEKEFEETRSLIERSPLMALHVFSYSPREGTEASAMKDAPPKHVAKARSAILKELAARKGEAFRGGFIGSKLEVLLENSRGADGNLKGFSDNYIPVAAPGPDAAMNTVACVTALREAGGRLEGEL